MKMQCQNIGSSQRKGQFGFATNIERLEGLWCLLFEGSVLPDIMFNFRILSDDIKDCESRIYMVMFFPMGILPWDPYIPTPESPTGPHLRVPLNSTNFAKM